MAYSDDEVAGVLDLFGALTRDELETALAELSFRRGDDHDEGDLSIAVRDALANYSVVPVDTDPEVLVAGPAAFPELPADADDLPHIVDIDRTAPSRQAAAAAAETNLRDDVDAALEADDEAELSRLLDVTYELEAWGPAAVADLRERIDASLD